MANEYIADYLHKNCTRHWTYHAGHNSSLYQRRNETGIKATIIQSMQDELSFILYSVTNDKGIVFEEKSFDVTASSSANIVGLIQHTVNNRYFKPTTVGTIPK